MVEIYVQVDFGSLTEKLKLWHSLVNNRVKNRKVCQSIGRVEDEEEHILNVNIFISVLVMLFG